MSNTLKILQEISSIIGDEKNWSKVHNAVDCNSDAVPFDSEHAVRWSLQGAFFKATAKATDEDFRSCIDALTHAIKKFHNSDLVFAAIRPEDHEEALAILGIAIQLATEEEPKKENPALKEKNPKSPIKSGWRGNINGYIEKTDSHVQVDKIQLTLDRETAWALCNILFDSSIEENTTLEKNQKEMMSELGAALGRLIDHSSTNNGDRQIIK